MYALSRALRTVPLTVVAFAHTQCESACPEEASYGKWQENWDGRSPLPGAKHKPGPTKHILLIRHGQYDRNDQHRQLTALGIEQARLTGERLAAMCDQNMADKLSAEPDGLAQTPITISCIYSSNLLRARQTAELFLQALPETVLAPEDPLLAEGCPCIPDPAPANYYPSPATVWEDGSRIEAAFRRYFHRAVDSHEIPSNRDPALLQAEGRQDEDEIDENESVEETWEIMVCHGNVIRYFVARALQLPPQVWLRMATYNCGITHVKINSNGRCSLVSFGDTGHLPLDKTTYF